jgi:iron complex outermembrane receptor protein
MKTSKPSSRAAIGDWAGRRARRLGSVTALGLAAVGGTSLGISTGVGAQPQPADSAAAPAAPAPGGLETIVVTASRREQRLSQAPATVSVITADDIARSAADDYGDLLRNVPGLNVSQTSVRDINMTGRGATSTLANSELVLVDGRSIYLDFFGFVMWDLVPIQTDEVDRIEVVRGPGSAVWGANAMSGVVNVITRRPKDMLGTTVVVGTPWASVVHAGADSALSYKVSAGYFEQPAYDRPTGQIPGTSPPQTYPAFENKGTHQSRVNAQVDWDLGDDGSVSVAGGYAQTDGILHSGIGPFDIQDGSHLSYFKADWNHGTWHVGAAGNFLDGNAINQLTYGSNGQLLPLSFAADTYMLDFSNTQELGARHSLTYGGNLRKTDYTLDIAKSASNRDEYGAFLQDEIALTEHLSWVVGARYDQIDPLDHAVVTPRTTLSISPSDKQTFRISYNEAFRTPSAINDYLDVTILQQLGPFFAPAHAVGNAALSEEQLKAYEVSYLRTFDNGVLLTVAAYRNEIADSIDFYVSNAYGPGNLPAPSPGLPAALIPCFVFSPGSGPPACPFSGLAGLVPSDYSYRNLGDTVNRGVELSLEQNLRDWTWYANASWQADPIVSAAGVDPADINLPPTWRVNLGVGHDVGKRFWTADVNYQDKAYWADVLNIRAWTSAFTQVNAAVGWRFSHGHLTLKVFAQNLFDERVQQHVFGDIISRKVAGQVSYKF